MIRQELIGAKITKGHLTIVIEQTKECEAICKRLNLDVFQPKTKKDVIEPNTSGK